MGLVSKMRRKKAIQEAEAEADALVAQAWSKFCLKADIAMLYTLRVTFGFGKERLERFYWALIENTLHMRSDYRCDPGDDYHYFGMKNELRCAGVDVDELQKEADRRYPVGGDE